MVKRLVPVGEVKLGQTLPADAFDEHGNLLWRSGQVITSGAQIAKLARGRMLADTAEDDGQDHARLSPLARIVVARSRLHELLTRVPPGDFAGKIGQVGELLRQACKDNPDLALASILMHREGPYASRHPVNVAIACCLTGAHLELAQHELDAVMAAALTMNIGMVELQQQLQSCDGPLDEQQHSTVRSHCERGVTMLRALGVEDPDWLAMVRDHHERADGSGYPAGLKGEAIALPTRLLSLADVYCARISGRDYRPPLQSTVALRWLYLNEGVAVDERMAAQFIKTMGVYPPGTGVRLRNGSVAVVTHRGLHGQSPRVASITTRDGLRTSAPIRRRGDVPDHAIAEVVNLDDLQLDMGMEALWGSDASC